MAKNYIALALFAAAAGWTDPTGLPAKGTASYYNSGVMEIVWQNRTMTHTVGPCPECIGAVAMLRRGDIGRKVWIEHKGEVLGPFMVVDCAGPRHYQALTARGEVVELPYALAQRWKMAGRIDVIVRDKPPEPAGIAGAAPSPGSGVSSFTDQPGSLDRTTHR